LYEAVTGYYWQYFVTGIKLHIVHRLFNGFKRNLNSYHFSNHFNNCGFSLVDSIYINLDSFELDV